MQDNKLDIAKIIESINKKDEAQEPKTDGAQGLVFEVSGEEHEEKREEPVPEPKKAEEKPEVREEFGIPDVFSVADVSVPAQTEDYTSHIHKTYVPRFTSASENYRVRESEHMPAERRATPTPKLVKDGKMNIDPTAELNEDSVEGAVVVDMTKPAPEEGGDGLKVYKFSEGESEKEAPRERTVDDEREEIESLLEQPSHPEETKDDEEETVHEAPKTAKDYELPDPDIEIKREEKKSEPEVKARASSEPHRGVVSEYSSKKDRDPIVQKFLDARFSKYIRFFASLVFALLTLGFEIAASLGAFDDKIFSIPVTSMAVGIVDLLLALCTLAIALPEVASALKNLATGKLMPSLSVILSFGVLTVYYLVIFAIGGISGYPLFGFIATVFAVVAVMSSLYKTLADFEVFKLVSKSDDMQALKTSLTREVPGENIALDGLVDEYKSHTSRAVSCEFVSGFMKKRSLVVNDNKHTLAVIAITLGVAIASAVISFFVLDGVYSAISALTVSVLLGLPAFSLASQSVSYSDSNESLSQIESGAVGEAAYFKAADTKVIVFNDTDIFGPDDVNLKRYIFLGEGDTIDGTMRQMCSLFSVVGGPLGALFANALDSRMTTKRAQNAVVESDGLAGDVGEHRVSAGSAAYMLRHGVKLPDTASESKLDTTKVLYATEDGKLTAKFYVRYSFSEEFTMAQPLLKKEGVVSLIYTSDPNITDELLKLLTAGSDTMRVIKVTEPRGGADEKSKSEPATIVTAADKMDLAGVVLHAKKHRRFVERLHSSELYAMAVGATLAVLLSLFGMLSVPAYLFSVWQIAWCFVMRIASRRSLAPQRHKKDKDAE